MPRYFEQIEVAAQTTESNAVTLDVEVDEQFIEDGVAFIDPGAKNKVFVELLDGEKRIFPTQSSDAFNVPAVSDPAPINHVLPGTPDTLTWRVYAPDADNDHIVLAYFDAKDLEVALPLQRLAETLTNGNGLSARRRRPSQRLSGMDTDT